MLVDLRCRSTRLSFSDLVASLAGTTASSPPEDTPPPLAPTGFSDAGAEACGTSTSVPPPAAAASIAAGENNGASTSMSSEPAVAPAVGAGAATTAAVSSPPALAAALEDKPLFRLSTCPFSVLSSARGLAAPLKESHPALPAAGVVPFSEPPLPPPPPPPLVLPAAEQPPSCECRPRPRPSPATSTSTFSSIPTPCCVRSFVSPVATVPFLPLETPPAGDPGGVCGLEKKLPEGHRGPS